MTLFINVRGAIRDYFIAITPFERVILITIIVIFYVIRVMDDISPTTIIYTSAGQAGACGHFVAQFGIFNCTVVVQTF